MKWEQDLVKDIKTYTDYDDRDSGEKHPFGYSHKINEKNEVIYPEEVTYCNRFHLLEQFNKIKNNCKAILEIGVGRNDSKSFIHVFLKNKEKDTIYVGIDVNDRTFFEDKENNVHIIQNDSSNYQENIKVFEKLGIDKFDFIFIDGWHSINQVLRDWEYTNLLSDTGIVGFHDTACHPGPSNFIQALDKNKWTVIENCCPEDWGIGFAQKKNIISENKLEGIPTVNCISLEESVERRDSLSTQFANFNIKNIKFVLSKRFTDSTDNISGRLAHTLNDGTAGCCVSHIKMIKQWLETTNEEYGFFCEDDLSLETVQYWDKNWKKAIEQLPEDWECVQLLTIRQDNLSLAIRERLWNDWGATTYILKRDYAQKIIDLYYKKDTYFLELPPPNDYIQPLIENLLFVIGRTYTMPLFVENISFTSTFVNRDEDINSADQHKKNHIIAYNKVISMWKNKNNVLYNFGRNIDDPENNFNMGIFYYEQGHTAPALSYFLRCAERTQDKILIYESLIYGYLCYREQKIRDETAKSLIMHAVCLLPERPEARWLLSVFHELKQEWMHCYYHACRGLDTYKQNIEPLTRYKDYPGKVGLLFQKAISGYWWEKHDECKSILLDLYNNYELNATYKQSVRENLNRTGIEVS
jgi:hypothetical protein